MACLDENVIVAFLQRRLDHQRTAEAEAHLQTCTACRALIEETALVFAPPEAETDRAAPLVPGAKIGRYVILRFIGAGAFGVVYAAFDPELDRKIALKVLRNERAAWRDRFVREARAMAKLSHPNVAQVYDVQANGARLSIAMEFIEGGTLAEWLAEPRPWPEVLRVFIAAGRGLAAAHAAGLIHRDFKPANVLISADGRICVTDFGLAKLASEEGKELAGTPRYMSPEQRAGEGSAAADQYSFAVALKEALSGEPRWVKRAIERALDPDPAKRHRSIDVMLEELAIEPRTRRNRRLGFAALGVLLAAIPAARIYDVERREATLCKGASAKVAELWNPEAQVALQNAFVSSGREHALETAQLASKALDRWFARWANDYTDACEATSVRGEQSEVVLTERMLCFERARAEARALLGELIAADAVTVDRAVESVQSLGSLDQCSDVEALLSPLAPPKPIKNAVEGVRAALAEARAARNTGRVARALEKTSRALEDAKELAHAPLLAEAELAIARCRAQSGAFDEAKRALRAAIQHAGRGHHDRVGGEAWIELIYLTGAIGEEEDVALALEDGARAELARSGERPEQVARLESSIGLILASKGRYAEAIARHRAALDAWERHSGKDSLEVGVEHHRLAEVLLAADQIDAAEDHAMRAQEIASEQYGGKHPINALPMAVLAELACRRRDFVECGRRIERAIAQRSSNGASIDHPAMLPKRLILVRALAGSGRVEEARRELEVASQTAPDDLWRARAMLLKAELDRDAVVAERAIGLMQAHWPKDHPELRAAISIRERLGNLTGEQEVKAQR